jgi:hypothetical protein
MIPTILVSVGAVAVATLVGALLAPPNLSAIRPHGCGSPPPGFGQ